MQADSQPTSQAANEPASQPASRPDRIQPRSKREGAKALNNPNVKPKKPVGQGREEAKEPKEPKGPKEPRDRKTKCACFLGKRALPMI